MGSRRGLKQLVQITFLSSPDLTEKGLNFDFRRNWAPLEAQERGVLHLLNCSCWICFRLLCPFYHAHCFPVSWSRATPIQVWLCKVGLALFQLFISPSRQCYLPVEIFNKGHNFSGPLYNHFYLHNYQRFVTKLPVGPLVLPLRALSPGCLRDICVAARASIPVPTPTSIVDSPVLSPTSIHGTIDIQSVPDS